MTQVESCGCTCGRPGCASNRTDRRDRRGRLLEHGQANTYDYHGCRCAECIEAHNVKVAESRRRTNEATKAEAENHGQEWDAAEIEVALRADLTATEAALALGRTMYGVKRIRKKYRR